MLGLLSFPNLTEPLVTGFALSNLPHLGVEVFEPFPFCIRWNFDRALLRNERHLIVGIHICRAVKDGADPRSDCHVVRSPTRLEQNAIAKFSRAI